MPPITYRFIVDSFSKDFVRLFPTQQLLFEFVDVENGHQNTSSGDPWRPFSLELDSDVERIDHFHKAVKTLDALLQEAGPSVFSLPCANKRPREETATSVNEVKSHLGQALLRGKVSSQQRFFAAIRSSFVYHFHAAIPATQQHLYEILREGVPCHFYLDVEQDFEYTTTTMHASVSEKLLQTSIVDDGWIPDDCCPWSCTVTPDHRQTTQMLLSLLGVFLEERDIGLSLGNAQILVLRSASLPPSTKDKFSQHYIIRFEGGMFGDCRDVGVLVNEFVDWLTARSATNKEMHAALFFHGEPKRYHMPCATDAIGQPELVASRCWMPRKCIIDTAVYSRNRMFRCLGSCKLGKAAIFSLDEYMSCDRGIGDAPQELFMKTLISFAAPSEIGCPILRLRESDGTAQHHATHRMSTRFCSSSSARHLLPSPFPLVDKFVASHLAERSRGKPTHWSLRGTADWQSIVYSVEGSRYCENVQREHKSNGVYYVVSCSGKSLTQKCFDPDCQNFRSVAVQVPPDCFVAVDAAPHFVESPDAALQQYRRLRTIVRFGSGNALCDAQ